MSKLVQTDVANMMRDMTSTAVINTDRDAFYSYKKERQRILKTETVERDVEELKKDLSEIKELLKQILENNNKY